MSGPVDMRGWNSDADLLAELAHVLNAEPFAATVIVFGQRLSRRIARMLERGLLNGRAA